jgi:hypothetical protein
MRTKWTGGVAKEAECLLCKHEDLIQTPVPPKQDETPIYKGPVILQNIL